MNRQRAYAPRDMANAAQLKAAILRRSRERGDSEPVRAWLLNHFYRHAVANFTPAPPALQEIDSPARARELFSEEVVPAWLQARLKQTDAARILWLDPHGEALLALEARLLEFLGSRQGTPLQDKLMRVNCAQALALWAAEHAVFEAQAAAGWREHQPAAVRTLWQGRDGAFVEFIADSPLLRAEMAYESQMMRHCLGQFADRANLSGGYGDHYASACESGKMRLFSYRSGQNHPHVTLNALVCDDGLLRVQQIKGKQNRPPVARYAADVMGFLNSLATTAETPPDAAQMNLVRTRRRWCPVSEVHEQTEQLQLMLEHPALLRELVQPCLAVQWLLAARSPQQLQHITLAPSVARALEPLPQS